MLSLHHNPSHAVPVPTRTAPLKNPRVCCARSFPSLKICSTDRNCLLNATNSRKTQDLGDRLHGRAMEREWDLCFPFHPGQTVLNITTPKSSQGQHRPDPWSLPQGLCRNGTTNTPRDWGPVTTQLLYSILRLYFIFIFLQYSRIQLILHNVYKLYHSALQSKA